MFADPVDFRNKFETELSLKYINRLVSLKRFTPIKSETEKLKILNFNNQVY